MQPHPNDGRRSRPKVSATQSSTHEFLYTVLVHQMRERPHIAQDDQVEQEEQEKEEKEEGSFKQQTRKESSTTQKEHGNGQIVKNSPKVKQC